MKADDWQYLRDQIRQRMLAKGFTQKSLALAAGQHATAVRDILTGRSKRPGADKVTAIARLLECSVEELTVRPGPTVAVPHYGTVPTHSEGGPPAGVKLAPEPNLTNMPLDVPILGTVRGGDAGHGDFRFNGESLGWAPRPPGLRGAAGAFCLYMQGGSMDPWRREGDPVYVQSGRPARVGDYVVVELRPAEDGEAPEALVKRLAAKSPDGALVLEQFAPPKRFTIPGARVLRVLRVVDWPELLRF